MIYKNLKISFIILCVFFINASVYAVSVSSWTWFQDIYKSTTSIDNIELANNITFGDALLPLGHNIIIDGGGHSLSGDSAYKWLSANSKDITLKDIRFQDFNISSGTSLDVMNNSIITFENQVDFSNNFVSITSWSILYSIDYKGTISAKDSKIYFSDSKSDFRDNAKISFTSNTASNPTDISVYGGVIYSSNTHIEFFKSTATFADNFNIDFSSNAIRNTIKVNLFGGAIYTAQSTISFMYSSITFTNNGSLKFQNNEENPSTYTYTTPPFFPMPFPVSPLAAAYGLPAFNVDKLNLDFSGAAVYILNSVLTVLNSKIDFSSNVSYSNAGALYAKDSTILFTESSATFRYNKTIKQHGGAAAILNENAISLLQISSSNFVFIGNTAGVYGGALYMLGSIANFNDSTFMLSDNKANYGGALFFNGAISSFNRSTASFMKNHSEYGGAIGLYDSKLSFNYSSINFSTNIAEGNSGAIYAEENSLVKFSSANALFSYNSAVGMSGGAIYLYSASLVFDNSAAQFDSNQSLWNGGAIFASGGSVIEFNNSTISFSSNSSQVNGGAISLLKSKLIFKDSNISFSSNSANQYGGAIYADNSEIIFEASTFSGQFDSNIADGDYLKNNDIYLTNKSQLKIKGQKINLDANILVQNKGKIESQAATTTFKSVYIAKDSQYIMTDGAKAQITTFSFIDIDGILGLGVNLNTLKADSIKTDDIFLEFDSSLFFTGYGSFSASFSVRIVEIFNSTTTAPNDRFAHTDSILDSRGGKINYTIVYSSDFVNPEHKWIDLNILGSAHLTDINGLTENQKNIAGILDGVNLITNPQMNDIGKPIFNSVFASYNADAIRTLHSLSGEFLANALSANLIRNNITELYPNIKREKSLVSVWTQYSFKSSVYDYDYGNLKTVMSGFQAGFNVSVKKNSIAGLYAFYENGDIRQSGSKVDIKDTGIGLVYGYLGKSRNFKANISASAQEYDSHRYIHNVGLIPSADFKSTSINIGSDLEFILKSPLFDFKPFIDLQYAMRMNDKITENGGGAADIIVNKRQFEKLTLFLGAGLGNETNTKFNWYGKIYIGHTFIGDDPQYKMSYISAPEYGSFDVHAHKTSATFTNIALGFKYNFNADFSAFINFDISPMSNALDYYAYMGAGYKFGKLKEDAQEQQPIETAEALEQEREAQKQRLIEPFTIEPMSNEKPDLSIQEIMTVAQSKALLQEQELQNEETYLGTIFRLTGTAFREKRFALTPAGKQIIENLAQTIKQYKYNTITIEGHTDYIENRSGLSQKRANAIFDELVKNGIPAGNITFKGLGPNDPLINNNKPASRIKNRRTDIIVK
ncbi:MAG: autotransporter domain-containing protein [Endomicrobium sp.]|jgi:predicted outer membrane repeat protein|nr:autotransporter domain-containing protein [Endomicrobium sp.]